MGMSWKWQHCYSWDTATKNREKSSFILWASIFFDQGSSRCNPGEGEKDNFFGRIQKVLISQYLEEEHVAILMNFLACHHAMWKKYSSPGKTKILPCSGAAPTQHSLNAYLSLGYQKKKVLLTWFLLSWQPVLSYILAYGLSHGFLTSSVGLWALNCTRWCQRTCDCWSVREKPAGTVIYFIFNQYPRHEWAFSPCSEVTISIQSWHTVFEKMSMVYNRTLADRVGWLKVCVYLSQYSKFTHCTYTACGFFSTFCTK